MKLLKVLQRIGGLLRPPRKRTGYLAGGVIPKSTVKPDPEEPFVKFPPGAEDARYSPVRYRL